MAEPKAGVSHMPQQLLVCGMGAWDVCVEGAPGPPYDIIAACDKLDHNMTPCWGLSHGSFDTHYLALQDTQWEASSRQHGMALYVDDAEVRSSRAASRVVGPNT